jgi:hypothetical protein
MGRPRTPPKKKMNTNSNLHDSKMLGSASCGKAKPCGSPARASQTATGSRKLKQISISINLQMPGLFPAHTQTFATMSASDWNNNLPWNRLEVSHNNKQNGASNQQNNGYARYVLPALSQRAHTLHLLHRSNIPSASDDMQNT